MLCPFFLYPKQQEGQLCAQHALNALLQMKVWDAVMLSDIANALDAQEAEKMAEGGIDSPEYQEWSKSGSKNMDDSGYFSVQVIQSALAQMDIQLINYTSDNDIAIRTRANPTEAQAFIIHFNHHWYTIRKIGHQWFNLNSLLSGPELLSESYLNLLLSQLINEKNHIFIVIGSIPDSDADKYLREHRIDPKSVIKPSLKITIPKSVLSQQYGSSSDAELPPNYWDTEAEDAIRAVKEVTTDSDGWTADEKALLFDTIEASKAASAEMEERTLQSILQQSLLESQNCSSSSNTSNVYSNNILTASTSRAEPQNPTNLTSLSEDEMLAIAIQMSQNQ